MTQSRTAPSADDTAPPPARARRFVSIDAWMADTGNTWHTAPTLPGDPYLPGRRDGATTQRRLRAH